MRDILRPALEEIADGKAHVEQEHVFYARVPDFSVLEKAKSWEHHEQWEIKAPKTEKNAGSARLRVRMTIKPGQAPEYVLTTKTIDPHTKGNIEVSTPVTEDVFVQFKIASENGMVKDRYFFPANDGSNLVYEVDMYLKDGAQPGSKDYYEWCKIDLEVPNMQTALPPIPEGFIDIISAPFGKRTEAEEARVTSLYHNEFTAKNAYLRLANQSA